MEMHHQRCLGTVRMDILAVKRERRPDHGAEIEPADHANLKVALELAGVGLHVFPCKEFVVAWSESPKREPS